MKGLAAFVMRGTSQAVLVTTALTLLALLLPLIGILGGAAVTLVTLRDGLASGLKVSVISTAVAAVFLLFTLGMPHFALFFLLMQWLPMVWLGQYLRMSRSLSATLQMALLIGLVVLGLQYIALSDPAVFWQEQFKPVIEQMVAGEIITADSAELLAGHIAVWMTGAIAAVVMLQLVISLLIARSWQAMLYNPGGFSSEFRGLRLHWVVGLLGLPALVLPLLPMEATPHIVKSISILLIVLLMLQGLAIAHARAALSPNGTLWLTVMYVLLVILMPQLTMLLAILGCADNWLHFRDRFNTNGEAG